ncbi:hypothetical protein ACYZUA_20120 [Pseudomonas sp. LS2P72]
MNILVVEDEPKTGNYPLNGLQRSQQRGPHLLRAVFPAQQLDE